MPTSTPPIETAFRPLEPLPVTKRSRHPDTWAAPYDDGGADTTVDAVSKQSRPKLCTEDG